MDRSRDAGTVIDLLAGLSSTGVDVTFVLDRRYQHGSNITQLKQRWPSARRLPVYTWQNDEDAIAKLHAKILIADRRDLLITSANLTGYGMRRNLEFGLRSKADQPRTRAIISRASSQAASSRKSRGPDTAGGPSSRLRRLPGAG